MGCKSCAERSYSRRLIRIANGSGEVSQQILEARQQICITCPHYKNEVCELLHGSSLPEYARRSGAICPHPDKKW